MIRHIVLFNNKSKAYVSLILDRIKITTLPKIRPEQYGYRPNYSNITLLVNVVNNKTNSLNLSLKSIAVTLDDEKGFNKLLLKSLIYNLIKLDVPLQTIKTIT